MTKVILSWGLGVDSTAILVRWLLDPSCREFDVGDLVVLTAQTGSEWPQTGQLIQQHVYPLLRAHGIRTVQVARAGASQHDGIVVLDDTRRPTVCHIEGAYTLAEEMLAAGTVPQVGGGKRLCSLKSKGWALDEWVARYTAGEDYLHAVGFELGELQRLRRDREQGHLAGRQPFYPLVEWGWHRADAEQYLQATLGVPFIKSACSFCPYALSSKTSREETIRRYLAHPDQAIEPLIMEHCAVALNPRQGLIAGQRLIDHLAALPEAEPLLRRFTAHLDDVQWAIYDVRRAFRARLDDPARMANAVRSVKRLAVGTRAAMQARLTAAATRHGRDLERDGAHRRLWMHHRAELYPCVEQLLVAAPALVIDKVNRDFAQVWAQARRAPGRSTAA